MACSPKTITKLVFAPSKKLKCFNCGCEVFSGLCHCGAKNWWHYDPCDGWVALGRIVSVRYVMDDSDHVEVIEKRGSTPP